MGTVGLATHGMISTNMNRQEEMWAGFHEELEPIPNMMLLIDADIMYHRAAFSVEDKFDFGHMESHVTDDQQVLSLFDRLLRGVLHKLESNRFLLCWSYDKNFRYDLYDDYKANRGSVRRPVCSQEVKKILMASYPSIAVDGLEADDLMGLHSGRSTIIVSDDKDLLTVPGAHYRPRRPEDGVFSVSEYAADYYWLTQVLTGDRTDNYKGIPGIGPKKAEKILKEGGVSWRTILKAYEDATLPAAEALMNARLARILRPGEYNWSTKKPILWEPDDSSNS